MQSEEDHNEAADDVDGGLVVLEQGTHTAGKGPQCHKRDSEAQYEAQGIFEGGEFAAAGGTAHQVGKIDGQHGQKARGDEGDEPFQKGDEILHGGVTAPFGCFPAAGSGQ